MTPTRLVLALSLAGACGAALPGPALFAALHAGWIVGGIWIAQLASGASTDGAAHAGLTGPGA